MKEAPPFITEGSTKEAQSQEPGKCIKERFLEDLNRILDKLPDLYAALSRAKRVQERRDANQRFNAKKEELERLVREGMKDTGTAIVIYDKLSRLLNRTRKHAPTVQFMLLNGIEQDVRHSPLGGKE